MISGALVTVEANFFSVQTIFPVRVIKPAIEAPTESGSILRSMEGGDPAAIDGVGCEALKAES